MRSGRLVRSLRRSRGSGMVARTTSNGFRVYRKKVPVLAKQMKRPFIVETLEGTMRGQSGDYLCVGIEGESWVVRRDIFEGTYELAPGLTPPSRPSKYSPE